MPRLGPISCVTVATPDLDGLAALYGRYLGYRVVEQGFVSLTQAALWARPTMAGRRFAILLPEGQGETSFRFVEAAPQTQDPVARAYVPFRHMGWNAAEIMVQDTDAVAAKLVGSPFRVIGPPADLSFSDKIRAMQVLGPANESLYLTSFKEKLAAFDTPDANTFVDRVFIVIVGGPSVAALNTWYSTHLGVPAAPVISAVISVLSNAHGLPADAKHELAALALHGQSYIEADTMPAATLPRNSSPGELPPGIAMVSFGVDRLPEGLPWLHAPAALPGAPYLGRRAAVCVGAGGELVELIES
jgi:catechol 2,3-dioxygenase-like lactoylglutathione lyase family enzyme